MTQNQTWQCSQCHTNNDLAEPGCRRCRTSRPADARRGRQDGQVRPPAPPYLMTPALAPRPAPPPAPEPRRGVNAGLLTVPVVLLAVLALVLFVDWGEESPSADVSSTETGAAGPAAEADPGEPPPPPPSPQEVLEQQAAADRPTVGALEERWVPQVSSKKVGLVVAGKTFDIDDVLADYVSWKQRYPEALLLWSGEYASFKHRDFWVVVIDRPFPDPESAKGWCDRESLGPDDCFARRLSHDPGSGPHVAHR